MLGWLFLVPIAAILSIPGDPAADQARTDPVAAAAQAEALALIAGMPQGLMRQQAATYLVRRLLYRGQCERALPILNRELIRLDDPDALGGIAIAVIAKRDARCMAWTAARLKAAAEEPGMPEQARAMLQMRATTLFNLVGQLSRAYAVGPVDSELLAVVPPELATRELKLDGLTVMVGISDAPSVYQLLLLEKLDAYGGTPLQGRLARYLAARAKHDPKLLTDSGWVEVGLVLLAEGDEGRAQQLLADAAVKLISLEGLRAEAALRRKEHAEALGIFARARWPVREKSYYRLIADSPELLIPYIDDDRFWDESDAELDLASLSEALDAAKDPLSAERAARASVRHAEERKEGRNGRLLGPNRHAQMLMRLGRVQEAQAVFAQATSRGEYDPDMMRAFMAQGAMARGDGASVFSLLGDVRQGAQTWVLAKFLAEVPHAPADLRGQLAAKLKARAGAKPILSESMIIDLAAAGAPADLMLALLEGDSASETSLSRTERAAMGAFVGGHAALARILADRAVVLRPPGRSGDASLLRMSRLFWLLDDPAMALRLARQVSHPFDKVAAVSQLISPRVQASRPKLSFETF